MLDLEQLVRKLIAAGWHRGDSETPADGKVLQAIRDKERSPGDRNKAVVEWLHLYRVLMGWPLRHREAVAGHIFAFADTGLRNSLHLDRSEILQEFVRLHSCIKAVAPVTRNGKQRDTLSLTSKALWCCYPEDVPIYDANAVRALGVISRISGFAPTLDRSEHSAYAEFIDVWLQLYWRIEAEIRREDLIDYPYKIRVLDRLLWYLGKPGFFDRGTGVDSGRLSE
jgi:hypothetical protein